MATRLLLVVAALIAASQAINFSQCGNREYGNLRLFDLMPNTIKLRNGEKVTVIYDVNVMKKFPERLQLQLAIRRDFGFLGKINLCNINRICQARTITCADIKRLLPQDAPRYDCPLPAGNYRKTLSLPIPNVDLSMFPSFVIGGTYEADIKLFNADNPNEEVVCVKVTDINISR